MSMGHLFGVAALMISLGSAVDACQTGMRDRAADPQCRAACLASPLKRVAFHDSGSPGGTGRRGHGDFGLDARVDSRGAMIFASGPARSDRLLGRAQTPRSAADQA